MSPAIILSIFPQLCSKYRGTIFNRLLQQTSEAYIDRLYSSIIKISEKCWVDAFVVVIM